MKKAAAQSVRQLFSGLFRKPIPIPTAAGSSQPKPRAPSGRLLASAATGPSGRAAGMLCKAASPMAQL